MNFLALLIALALHQFLRPGSRLQCRDWIVTADRRLRPRITGAALRLILLLVAVGGGGLLLLAWMEPWLFGLPELLLTALMLVWSLGGCDYHTAAERFAVAGDDPHEAARAVAPLWMPVADDQPAAPAASMRLLYAGYARWFTPVFFFVVLGPIAAVLYRSVAVLATRVEAHDPPTYLGVLRALDWLPARCLTLTFALVGDFLAVLNGGGLRAAASGTDATVLLDLAARAACGSSAGPRAYADLLYRSAGLWLLVTSLVYLLF